LVQIGFAPSVAPLGALSFKLHKELAAKNNGRKIWGYSSSIGISLSRDSDDAVGGSGEDWMRDGTSRASAANTKNIAVSDSPAWLKKDGGTQEIISREGSVAQVDPLRFCTWLLESVRARGVEVHYPARAISVSKDENGYLDGVRISKDGTETERMLPSSTPFLRPMLTTAVPCTRLIITAGAWSPTLFRTLFPASKTQIPISQLAGHSLLLKNHFFKDDESDVCHAVFATDTLGFSPEYFARAGGEVYLAGLNSTMIPLPERASDSKPSPEAIKQLKDCAVAMMGTLEGREVEVTREALCFRAVTSSGRPIVSRISDERLGGGFKTRTGVEGGVFLAAGHGAWGISQGPGTGCVMAELVEGRGTSADIGALGLP
jgi:glycine/D-amino acid oxidase-like deaminating enzyme